MRPHAHERINPPREKRRKGNRKPVPDSVFGWASAATLSVLATAFLLIVTGPALRTVDPDADLITGTVDGKEHETDRWSRMPATVQPKTDIARMPALATQDQIDRLQRELDTLKEREATLRAENSSLARRISALEREFDGFTGSISPTPPPPAEHRPREISAAPRIPVPGGDIAVRVVPLDPELLSKENLDDEKAVPAGLPATLIDTQAASAARNIPSITTHTKFGADLGGAQTFAELGQKWKSYRAAHPDLFTGLTPKVAAREDIDRVLELRLVAGPFTNAADAALFCARMQEEGTRCRPVVFEGQRLIVQDAR